MSFLLAWFADVVLVATVDFELLWSEVKVLLTKSRISFSFFSWASTYLWIYSSYWRLSKSISQVSPCMFFSVSLLRLSCIFLTDASCRVAKSFMSLLIQPIFFSIWTVRNPLIVEMGIFPSLLIANSENKSLRTCSSKKFKGIFVSSSVKNYIIYWLSPPSSLLSLITLRFLIISITYSSFTPPFSEANVFLHFFFTYINIL